MTLIQQLNKIKYTYRLNHLISVFEQSLLSENIIQFIKENQLNFTLTQIFRIYYEPQIIAFQHDLILLGFNKKNLPILDYNEPELFCCQNLEILREVKRLYEK